MRTSRLEAFSDGVLAIIITIMVLGLREPGGKDLASLWHAGLGEERDYEVNGPGLVAGSR
jgi:uncharacterized membrane protein